VGTQGIGGSRVIQHWELPDGKNKAKPALESGQVDELNGRHGRQAVLIVPVGDAVNKLRARVAAGQFPGVASQAALFRDPIGHGLGHVQALAAYCNFAAIYRRTPEGLQLNEPGVTAEQHAILQRIAWETVSDYSRSGLPEP
jgi:hypothetical protein